MALRSCHTLATPRLGRFTLPCVPSAPVSNKLRRQGEKLVSHGAPARVVHALSSPAGAAGPAAEREQLKGRLRQLVTKVNAAALPGPADLAALYGTMEALAALNPHPDTATSSLINGRWVLLYTASMASLKQAAASAGTAGAGAAGTGAGRAGAAAAAAAAPGGDDGGGAGSGLSGAASLLQLANDTAYKFFYDNLPVLAGAAVGSRGASSSGPVKARGNFQVFDTSAGRVENQARFEVGGRQCAINVNGTAEVAQLPGGRPQQRLRAVFTSFQLTVDGQPRLSLPLSLLNPVGYVDTTYLDNEVGRTRGAPAAAMP